MEGQIGSHWLLQSATFCYHSNPLVLYTVSLGVVYVLYYLTVVVQKPELIAKKGGKFQQFLQENCPVVEERFWPTLWATGAHAQTIMSSVVRTLLRDVPYNREILELSDGGLVALDWLDTSPGPNDKPIALFMPGLTGDSQTEYIKSIVPVALRQGCRCVVFNNRGRGGIELRTARLYCALDTGDLREVLQHVKMRYPSSPIIATGMSLGSMILTHYLITHGEDALIDAVMLISAVFDAPVAVDNLEKGSLNSFLNKRLAKCMCEAIEPHKEKFKSRLNMNLVLNSQTVREFDENFTSKSFGFSGAHEYYKTATTKHKLSSVRVPTLCLNAADDMFAPLEALPVDEIRNCDYFAMLLTSRGGHIGFMDGPVPTAPFYSERVYGQYLSALMNACSSGNRLLSLLKS